MDRSGKTWELCRRHGLQGMSRRSPGVVVSDKEWIAMPELRVMGQVESKGQELVSESEVL